MNERATFFVLCDVQPEAKKAVQRTEYYTKWHKYSAALLAIDECNAWFALRVSK